MCECVSVCVCVCVCVFKEGLSVCIYFFNAHCACFHQQLTSDMYDCVFQCVCTHMSVFCVGH